MTDNTLPTPNVLTAVPAPGGTSPLGRFGGPLAQVKGLLAQPAVKRSLPLVAVVAMIGLAALAWAMLHTPAQRTLHAGLGDADKAAVAEALDKAGIANRIDGAGTLTVGEDDYYRARMLLAAQNLPKSDPGGYAILDQLPLGVSRAVEGERLRQARETELARSIEEIDGVADARVHLAMPEQSVFLRENASPSASVVVRLHNGRTLGEAQVRSVISLVASSVPGMTPDDVTVVDGSGALLSKAGGGLGDSAGDKRIDFQRRVEDKYRSQLASLLTPLIGSGNFTAEVQAEINLNETQATRERYDNDGRALRAEEGSWTGAGGEAIAAGVPGALTNAPPPPAVPAAPGTPPADATAAATPPKQSDQFARSFEVGKEISVTREAPGSVRRLSVAVVLREAEGARRRTPAEIEQLTGLVRAAVGYDQARGDQVTVLSRAFAGAIDQEVEAPWYEAGWLPMVARNATALVIALLVLLIGVRPLIRGLTRPKEAAAAEAGLPLGAPAGSSPDEDAPVAPRPKVGAAPTVNLDSARSYDEKVAIVRDFTRDNPARAALAVRDMIRS